MEKIYYNGRIYSIDEENHTYTAIGVEHGRIVFLGTDIEAQGIEAEEYVDLQGACVLPGFIDSHLHLLNYAYVEKSYKMFDACSVREIITEGRRRADAMAGEPASKWFYGRGWNHQNFTDEKRLLTRQDLDQISTERPILFIRVCGHAAAVNTKGLEIVLGLPEATEYMEQIDTERGILTEASVKLCYNVMDAPSLKELKELILEGQTDLHARGITSVESDNFLSLPGRNGEKIIQAHQELEREGKLTLRIREQPSFTCFEDMKSFIDAGYRTGQGGAFYSIGPVKLYQDGSLGARTALLNWPYADQKDTCGTMLHTEEDLQQCVDYAYKNHMQIIVHAIGDRASDMVCTAYERAIKSYGRRDHRMAINHLQIVSPDLFDRMAAEKILAYIQPVFVASDKDIIRDFIGGEREHRSYAWKTMLRKGVRCCGSSDAPVESFDVLSGIQAAVTRDGFDEWSEGWHPEQKLTIEEAVRLFTIDNAYGAFQEKEKGSLEIGKLADMVVLGEDIFQTEPHEIIRIPILKTIVGGKAVWSLTHGS